MLFTFLAFFTRMYKIGLSPIVTWDEAQSVHPFLPFALLARAVTHTHTHTHIQTHRPRLTSSSSSPALANSDLTVRHLDACTLLLNRTHAGASFRRGPLPPPPPPPPPIQPPTPSSSDILPPDRCPARS
ncbi:MAG: hypothetical protein OK454_11015 [Thaumarchaeota archaeon]|nr:hypothetical protein [Nitrososphaerota archaeon]